MEESSNWLRKLLSSQGSRGEEAPCSNSPARANMPETACSVRAELRAEPPLHALAEPHVTPPAPFGVTFPSRPLDVPVLLAPMAGVNDIAFRALCLECGADLTYTEMVSSKALSFANEKTRHLLDRAQGERVVAVQLFGHEPDTMAREAAWIEQEMGEALAYIDINMGCPARKIVKKGAYDRARCGALDRRAGGACG